MRFVNDKLQTGPVRPKQKTAANLPNRRSCGADDEARTRYLHLGKVALYQMSYIRIDLQKVLYHNFCTCQENLQAFFVIKFAFRIELDVLPTFNESEK